MEAQRTVQGKERKRAGKVENWRSLDFLWLGGWRDADGHHKNMRKCFKVT